MSFNISNLSEYVGEQRLGLIQLMTAPLDGVMAGVEFYDGFKAGTKEKWTVPTATTVFNAGTCSETVAGGIGFHQIDVNIGKFGVTEKYCISDLNTTWLRTEMKKGSYDSVGDSMEAMFAVLKAEDIAQNLADMYWNGDILNGDNIDGILTQLRASSDVIDGNPDAIAAIPDGTTPGELLEIFDTQIELLPDNALFSGKTIYMHTSTVLFKKLINDMRKANNYHFTGDWSNMMIDYPNYPNVKIVGNTKITDNVIVTTFDGNLAGFEDDKSDKDRGFNVDSYKSYEFELDIRFAYGAAIKFEDLVVFFELASAS